MNIEELLAILSFWAWYSANKENIRVVVYTDNPSFFEIYLKGILVEFWLVTPEKWEEMLCGHDFKFYRKISVIKEAFTSYPLDNILFIDPDTFFISDPASLISGIVQGATFMHLLDFTFDEGYPYATSEQNSKFLEWLESREFFIGERLYHFNRSNVSWNAGVIGMTSEISSFIPDVFRLTKEMYEETSFHVSEQLAFALVLQTTTKLYPSDKYVLHYWPNKALPISGLSPKLYNHLSMVAFNRKQEVIKHLTIYLLFVFKSTISFNSNKYFSGYKYALQAFVLYVLKERRAINIVHLAKVVVFNTLRLLKLIKPNS